MNVDEKTKPRETLQVGSVESETEAELVLFNLQIGEYSFAIRRIRATRMDNNDTWWVAPVKMSETL